MALPLFRLPIWSSSKAKMTTKQLASWSSHLPSRDARHVAWRIACCLSSVLLLYGCSTPPPLTLMPSDQPPPVTTVPSAPLAEEIPPSAPEKEPTAPVSEENSIFFALRSAIVSDTGKEKLRLHADRLKLDRKETVLLIGHADDQGSRNYNLAITEERLMAVEKQLRTYGVPLRQIRRNRSGSVKHLPSCTTNECRRQMRRVELIYSQ
ncbi:MAG: OmpA/MotB [Proteobacteria bacterium]|nr:OmpA/MotB [Pseudomonadota bacterium]